MKKTISLLVLLCALTVSVFADGQIPTGGRSCPDGATCLFDTDDKETADHERKLPWLQTIFGNLKFIFR